MKEIKEEVVRTEYKIRYQAIDGEIFDSKEECQKYDNSAIAVVQKKYNELVLQKDMCEYDILNLGCEDNYMEIIKVESKEDADLVKQLYMLINPYYQDKEIPEWMKKDFEQIDKAVKDKDILFIGRGYEKDGFWIYGSTKSLCAEINEFKKLLNTKTESKPEPEYGGC